MPKILINEKDYTTPGMPGNYANYAVLITGFAGKVANPVIKADPNNAYEFSSAQTFIDTIGLLPPAMQKITAESTLRFDHYGNQMAYELLKSGYPVIYRSLGNIDDDYENTAEVVSTLTDANIWEPFKDKASYDFRFVTHGLLTSSEISKEASAKLYAATELKTLLEAAEAALKSIEIDAENEAENNKTNPDFDKTEYIEEAFIEIRDVYAGFVDEKGEKYLDYDSAVEGIKARKAQTTKVISEIENSHITASHINTINGHIAELAAYTPVENPTNQTVTGRGDCIALIELDERCYTTPQENVVKPEELIVEGIAEMSAFIGDKGKYCALTVPSVVYKMSDNSDFGNNKKFPGAFHYLTCFINSIRTGFAEWYAAAGYARGISNYTIDHTTVKLGEIAINALEPRNLINEEKDPKFACNVIASFRGSYYLWGNRTAHPLGKKGNLETGDLVASSFLNIRQLCTTIKKQLYVACRTFTFDPNSDSLWVNFVNSIRPTLEVMKADQGIRDYKIIKVSDESPQKASLKAKIRIIPIEAVEDFDLEVSLEDSFGETTSVINE